MAKTVKVTKGDIFLLFTVWNKVPTSKIAADGAKYVAVRKAFKKAIKNYLEDRSDIEEQAREKLIELDKKHLQPLRTKLEKAEEEEKEFITQQITQKGNELNAHILPYNEKLNGLFKAIQKEEAEVVFDNEDFLYFSDFCKANSAELCSVEGRSNGDKKETERQLDPEAMEKLFDFIALAQ